VGTLDAFGAFDRAETAALGALVDYVDLTQKGRAPRLDPPRRQRRAQPPREFSHRSSDSGSDLRVPRRAP
jgi:hypothetical protein